MTKTTVSVETNHPQQKRRRHRLHGIVTDQIPTVSDCPSVEINVGRHLRKLRPSAVYPFAPWLSKAD